jgi:hypothetical protein
MNLLIFIFFKNICDNTLLKDGEITLGYVKFKKSKLFLLIVVFNTNSLNLIL